jgi:predicted dienelactone hydrolase
MNPLYGSATLVAMTFSVGCREISTLDPVQQAPLRAWVLYPSRAAAQTVRFGPYALELAPNGPPAAEHVPVVVFSHGNSGTPWSHRGLATHLVRDGFAVTMLEHPGNNRHDNSLSDAAGRVKAVLLQHRPRHIRLAFDAALADAEVGPILERERFAMVGESIGAYTALAVAGGHARTVPDDVESARLRAPDAELLELSFPVPTERDRRLAAAVLLAPAIGFFLAEGALAEVEIPLLVRTGERDPLAPTAQVARALSSLPAPARLSMAEVPGAGHFSLQTPYPPELSGIPPAQDPPGFDRAGYQRIFYADVTEFLRRSTESR